MNLPCLVALLPCSGTWRSISLSFPGDQHSQTPYSRCFRQVPGHSFQFQSLLCHPWNCLTVSPPQFPCLVLFLLWLALFLCEISLLIYLWLNFSLWLMCAYYGAVSFPVSSWSLCSYLLALFCCCVLF